MAFPSSGLFVVTFVDVFDTTQLALDLDLETHKIALFNNSVTGADLTTDTAYGTGAWGSNESSGTGYSAGGAALTSTTFTHQSGGLVVFDAADSSWSTASITARGGLIYADALAGNNAIAAINFGADYTSTAGTFLVTWTAPASGGVFGFDLIP